MTYSSFIKKYVGKYVDFDGALGYQCADLVQQYNKDVIGGKPFRGNAIDFWTTYDKTKYKQVPNRWYTIARKGDIAVFGKKITPYGHVDIVYRDRWHIPTLRTFSSFSQNWPVGSRCRVIKHPMYYGVIGFLRKR